MRVCTKREVTEAVLKAFVASHSHSLRFDGMRYTYQIEQRSGVGPKTVWNKPVAFVTADTPPRFYLIEDA